MTFKRIVFLLLIATGSAVMAFNSNFEKNNEISTIHRALPQAKNYRPIVVLELFTSQGCSSCPPADALLDKVKNEFEDVVYPLSYHVDYWNYIGWEDPFSNSKFTERQKAYNIKFKNRSNYTPQIIVNGKEHFVGSNTSKLYGAIDRYRDQKTTNQINFTYLESNKNSISFKYDILGSIEDRTLHALLVLDRRTTQVQRGENRNRKLLNSNIVVGEKYVTLDESGGESFIVVPEIVSPDDKISLLLLVENNKNDITGASKSTVSR